MKLHATTRLALRRICPRIGRGTSRQRRALPEKLLFQSGTQLWNWLANSNPIVGTVLAELSLTEEQTSVVRQALDRMVRERAKGNGPAVLTNPVHIGIGTK